MPEPTLETEFLFDIKADLKPPVATGAGPLGQRMIFDVTGGWFEGPKLKGEVLPSGGDWLRVRSDNVMELDVRATMKTDDGAIIYVSYTGLLKLPPPTYFRTTPRLYTGDERYAWLNDIICVAIGNPEHLNVGQNQVGYRVFQVL